MTDQGVPHFQDRYPKPGHPSANTAWSQLRADSVLRVRGISHERRISPEVGAGEGSAAVRSARRQTVVVAGFLAGAVVLGACSSSPPPVTAHGTLAVYAPLGNNTQDAYPDITSGAQVTVTNPSGTVIGTGTLAYSQSKTSSLRGVSHNSQAARLRPGPEHGRLHLHRHRAARRGGPVRLQRRDQPGDHLGAALAGKEPTTDARVAVVIAACRIP